MEHYYELKWGDPRDPATMLIPPASAADIRKRWDAGQPIHLSNGTSIPASQIRSFELTDKPFTTQKLLDDASQAFHEPQYNEDDSVVAQWVKKQVTAQSYAKMYSPNPAYHKLEGDGNMVTIAFRVPIHMVNRLATPYCTKQEIERLTHNQQT